MKLDYFHARCRIFGLQLELELRFAHRVELLDQHTGLADFVAAHEPAQLAGPFDQFLGVRPRLELLRAMNDVDYGARTDGLQVLNQLSRMASVGVRGIDLGVRGT